jgi:hypothetical protein
VYRVLSKEVNMKYKLKISEMMMFCGTYTRQLENNIELELIEIYCDKKSESRNSPLLRNVSVNMFPWK